MGGDGRTMKKKLLFTLIGIFYFIFLVSQVSATEYENRVRPYYLNIPLDNPSSSINTINEVNDSYRTTYYGFNDAFNRIQANFSIPNYDDSVTHSFVFDVWADGVMYRDVTSYICGDSGDTRLCAFNYTSNQYERFMDFPSTLEYQEIIINGDFISSEGNFSVIRSEINGVSSANFEIYDLHIKYNSTNNPREIYGFNNTLQTEDLDFDVSSANHTRYLRILKNSVVSFAKMMFDGYEYLSSWTKPSMEVSTNDGSVEWDYPTRNYSNEIATFYSSNAHYARNVDCGVDDANFYDDDWTTAHTSCWLIVTANVTNSDIFTIIHDANYTKESLSPLSIYYKSSYSKTLIGTNIASCFNSSDKWEQFRSDTCASTPCNITNAIPESCLSGTLIQIRDMINFTPMSGHEGSWYSQNFYDRELIYNYPLLKTANEITGQLNSSINTALNSGACDCVGCSLEGDYCLIPFHFNSSLDGGLTYDSIEVFYTSSSTITNNITKPDSVYSNTDWLVNLTAIDTGELYLSSYVQFYVNDTKIGGESYFNLTNNTNSKVASLLNGNFSNGDNLTAEVWIYNNIANSTKVNMTATVKNSLNISLNIPTHLSIQPVYTEFNCSVSSTNDLVNITLHIWNSTGYLFNKTTTEITGTSNSTLIPITFTYDDTFTWNCLSENDIPETNWADSNYTVYSSINSPATNLDYPTNNDYLNNSNVYFNFTSTDTDGLSECQLWGNWTGGWHNNYTWSNPVDATQNFTNLNLPDSNSLWNVWCNDSLGNGAFSINNFSLVVDTILPTMNNMTITTTADQTQFNFTSNITDTNLDSCKYSVWTGSTPGTNNSFTCNDNITATAPGFGTYSLYLYATDLAGNENSQFLSFTTSVSGGGVVTGGGGSSSTIIVSTDKGWIMESSKGQAKFEADMSKGTERKFNIQFENLGDSSKTITLSCQDIKGLACQYVEFPEETFELALLKDTKQTVSFLINLPDTAKKGDYQFNIRALDDQERDGTVTVFLGIGTLGIFQAFISKVLFTRTNFGFPYALIFFPSLIILFIASSKLIKKGTPLKPIWVILISLITSIFLVWLI